MVKNVNEWIYVWKVPVGKSFSYIELDPEIHKIAVERLGKLGVPEKNIICGNALDSKTYQLLPFTKKNTVFSNGLRFGKTK